MTASRAYVLKELRLVRVAFVLALVAHLAATFLTGNRSYARLLLLEPPVVPMLFAAWLGYHRVYAEQARGTWLVQPFSRARAIALKALVAVPAIVGLALVHALSVYAWVASSDAPFGPVLSFDAYLIAAASRDVGAALAILAAVCCASFTESRARRVAWVAAALVWSALVYADGQTEFVPFGAEAFRSTWSPMMAIVVACIGGAATLASVDDFGRSASVRGEIVSAIWLTPLLFMVLELGNALASPDPAQRWREPVLLRDGEVVVVDFERGGSGHAQRRDGRSVEIVRSTPVRSDEAELVSWGARPSPFGQSWWTGRYEAFLGEDARTVLLYDPRNGALAACWGAEGVRPTAPCAPFERVVSLSQLHVDGSLTALQLVTADAVIDLDEDGTVHERFRGDAIEDVAVLDSGSARVVLADDAATVIGRVDRTCPAISPGARVGLLDDDTLVSVGERTVTYCRASEVTTASWPHVASPPTLAIGTALILPAGATPAPAMSTWWAALALRALGALVLTLAFRRRGFLIALPGLLLGPAYFAAAALVLADASVIAAWWSRFRARFERRAPLAEGASR